MSELGHPRSKATPSKELSVPLGFLPDKPEQTEVKPWYENILVIVVDQQLRIPKLYIIHVFLLGLIGLLTWSILYFSLDEHMLPSGELFHLCSLVLTAYLVGVIFSIFKLPDLIGQLVTGMLFRYMGWIHVKPPYTKFVSVSRDVAIAAILTKAGLGLDGSILKDQKYTIMKLCLLPCLGEALSAAAVSVFTYGLRWDWGLLLGFLLSSVSPAVVIPPLLALKKEGYGETQGIYTLVVASSSLDDISSITAYGVFYTIIFGTGSLWLKILNPFSIIVGVLAGIFWGLFVGVFPHKEHEHVVALRSILLGLGSVSCILVTVDMGFAGVGPLFCITAAFMANVAWRRQGWRDLYPSPVEVIYSGVWIVMEPILFSFIGAEIDFQQLYWKEVCYGVLIVVVALVFRVVCCFIALIGTSLNLKEKIFVNIAWMPKATVQAALSPQPLDQLRRMEKTDSIEYTWAVLLLNTAIISILLTTPVCSLVMTSLGTLFLRKDVPDSVRTYTGSF